MAIGFGGTENVSDLSLEPVVCEPVQLPFDQPSEWVSNAVNGQVGDGQGAVAG